MCWLTPTSPAGSWGSKQINRPTWEMDAHLLRAMVIKQILQIPPFSCSLMTLMGSNALRDPLLHWLGQQPQYNVLIWLRDGHSWAQRGQNRQRGLRWVFVVYASNMQRTGSACMLMYVKMSSVWGLWSCVVEKFCWRWQAAVCKWQESWLLSAVDILYWICSCFVELHGLNCSQI